ncbi:MAG: hypothetical protein D6698_10145 [Gammaproteobacteria bacterium]|nr:MAG: hypothetical protein D6698_10145 [Gammaproteobacteria bacterium]
MNPTLRTAILKRTPPEFRQLMAAEMSKLEEEFDIFLKMGFSSSELTFEIDAQETPPTVHVVPNLMHNSKRIK